MGQTVLVVDDDKNLRISVGAHLERAGYEVLTATDGREALRVTYGERPDLIILDVMMPEMDGWEVCEQVRTMADTPIIMLTARSDRSDVVKGLKLGADDYLEKPFDGEELLARVESVLRRARVPERDAQKTYDDGYLAVNLDRRRVTVDGERVTLSQIEFDLLALVVRNPRRVLTYDQILENVWGIGYTQQPHYVRTYIWHLRQKIEPDPHAPRYLINDLGVGYHFEPRP